MTFRLRQSALRDPDRAASVAACLPGRVVPTLSTPPLNGNSNVNLRDMLIREEGYEHKAYRDSLGNTTIGVGHLAVGLPLSTVWTDEQIDEALQADIDRASSQCEQAFPWFNGLDETRQAVVVAMTYQMGISRLLKFTNTLKAIGEGRYSDAADGMRASVWAHQTPHRAIRMAEQMETGKWA